MLDGRGRLMAMLDDTLRAVMEAQANLYARFHGLPDPYPRNEVTGDDRSAEAENRFIAKAVVEARSYSETNSPTFDYVPGLEDGPHRPPEGGDE